METLYKCEKCNAIYTEEELVELGNPYRCGCGYTFGQDKWKITTPVEIKKLRLKARVVSDYLETDWNDELEIYYQTSIISNKGDFSNVWNHKTRIEAEICHRKVVNALFYGKVTVFEDEIRLNPPILCSF